MKRFLTSIIAIVMLVSFTDASAQGHRHSRPHRDLHTASEGLGINFSYVHSLYRLNDWATDNVKTSDGLDGVNFGITKDFGLIDNALFLQTGLVYTYQNDNLNEKMASTVVYGDWNEHFLSIPLKVKYEIPVLHNLSVFVMGGPTFVGGLASQMKYRARINDENVAISYNCFSGKVRSNNDFLDDIVSGNFHEMRYRRADVQLGFSAGVTFMEILEAQIGYDWGLVNKYKGENFTDLKMRRQQFYIGIGLRF